MARLTEFGPTRLGAISLNLFPNSCGRQVWGNLLVLLQTFLLTDVRAFGIMEKCRTKAASQPRALARTQARVPKTFKKKKNRRRNVELLAKPHIPLAQMVLLSDRLSLKWMEFCRPRPPRRGWNLTRQLLLCKRCDLWPRGWRHMEIFLLTCLFLHRNVLSSFFLSVSCLNVLKAWKNKKEEKKKKNIASQHSSALKIRQLLWSNPKSV